MSFFDDLGHAGGAPNSGRAARRQRAGARTAVVAVAIVVLLLGLGYVGLAAYAGDSVPPGASVAGVGIGGQSPDRAENTLRRALAPRLEHPATLTHRGRQFSFVPAEAGVTIDYPATLRAAGAIAGWSPARLWDWASRSDDTAVVLDVDRGLLAAALDKMNVQFDEQGVEGSIDFSSGKAVPVFGRAGRRVDEGAVARMLDQIVFGGVVAEVPVVSTDPYISRAAVREAMESFGEPAMSAPVVVRIGPVSVVVPPEILGKALTAIPNAGKLTPSIDGDRLMTLLEPRMTTIGDKPRDGSVSVVDGRLVQRPAVIGASWDNSELDQSLPEVLTRPVGERILTLQAAITRPKVTDKVVAGWGIRRRMTGFRVRLGAPDAATLAAVAALDNLRVEPGQTFSLLDTVGPAGLGAQASALGGAVFDAAYGLGLADTQHTSSPIRDPRFPVGGEIVVDSSHDLEFVNTTTHAVLISATLDQGDLEVGLWSSPYHRVAISTSAATHRVAPGVRRDRGSNCRPSKGTAGYTVLVTRRVRSPGSGMTSDRRTITYPPVASVTC